MWIVTETKKGIKDGLNLKENKKEKRQTSGKSFWGFEDIKPNKIINFVKIIN